MSKETVFKDSNGTVIKIGDNIMIFATNQYNGVVNDIDGEPYLDTAFFNEPLVGHLTAIDFQDCYIINE